MDFSKTNIQKILKSAIRLKFADFDPSDFEDFIAYLFISNDYEVEQTKYSGDYGVDLIIKKDEINKAVQVKRFQAKNKVAVKDINQVRGGSEFYKCNSSLIITTSSFSKPAVNLARESGVELWDWNRLQKYICDTFLDGKDYYEYFQINHSEDSDGDEFSFDVTKIRYNVEMKKAANATLIYIKITNNTERNLNLGCYLPTYITKDNNQYEATSHLQGYFSSGTVYAGCTVAACFIFEYDQLSKIKDGDKLILTLAIDQEKTKTYYIYMKDYEDKGPEGKCFIASVAFESTQDPYVNALRNWRDKELNENAIGRKLIEYYNCHSPKIAVYIKDKKIIKKTVRILLRLFCIFLRKDRQ